jgi:prophage maintenance system killer protein
MSHSPAREPESLPSLHYLTVQDMLWINFQITKKTHSFDFAKLEEGVFYQYAYGGSADVLQQASQFANGFAKNRPFTQGNVACAFVGTVAFLLMNGFGLNLSDDDGVAWMERCLNSQNAAKAAIQETAVQDESTHSALLQNVQQSVGEVLQRYPKTIEALAGRN